jgi:hypothetical protein
MEQPELTLDLYALKIRHCKGSTERISSVESASAFDKDGNALNAYGIPVKYRMNPIGAFVTSLFSTDFRSTNAVARSEYIWWTLQLKRNSIVDDRDGRDLHLLLEVYKSEETLDEGRIVSTTGFKLADDPSDILKTYTYDRDRLTQEESWYKTNANADQRKVTLKHGTAFVYAKILQITKGTKVKREKFRVTFVCDPSMHETDADWHALKQLVLHTGPFVVDSKRSLKDAAKQANENLNASPSQLRFSDLSNPQVRYHVLLLLRALLV